MFRVVLRAAGLCLASLLAVAGPREAHAQLEPEFYNDQPYAYGEWTMGRRVDDSQFRYCVDPRDPGFEQDGDVAEAIARALLLQPQRYVIPNTFEVEDLTRLYSILLQQCDVVMGFKLIPGGYPPWVGLTRAYTQVSYLFVTAKPDLRSLGDLPPGRPIAATGGTSAHVRLASYNLSLAPAKRWPIFPYGTDQMALEGLASGAADVALVWDPSFRALQKTNAAVASFRVIAPDPLPPTTLGVGGLMLRQNTFLRNAIDQAIAALTSDGSLAAIAAKFAAQAGGKPR
ncbi:ABC transporter substrate-binding protein [uncultured Alsobacter sp.]|uniref:substrate-binding periplasmic protein n=1 Tax=uncultured Alsobacter sp. TaxID=1748258 RepID=UPI0025E438CC|nr:transporter substrate-binding domain-containing protein [uncultured Alsobacter sp.]